MAYKSREITLGGFGLVPVMKIGGDNPKTIQTMWKEPIDDVTIDSPKLERIVMQINDLKALGCDIVRFAVPDMESARGLALIQERSSVPLVADIHFDHRLALECLKNNIAAVRINPGNIGSKEKLKEVLEESKKHGSVLRIGVNSGSLPKDLEEQVIAGTLSRAKALSMAALRECDMFEEMGWTNYAVSMKASSVEETVEANREFARCNDAPLHIGVTEAGPLIAGIVKSTLAFSTLLREGIGDTIRVSLSSAPENEVITGREILHECGFRKEGISLVSCPRCGRIGFDVHSFMDRWQSELYSIKKNITVAVMGCVVNGPGEGKHADIGIAGGKDKVIIFKKGQIVRTVESQYADKVFREELESLLK